MVKECWSIDEVYYHKGVLDPDESFDDVIFNFLNDMFEYHPEIEEEGPYLTCTPLPKIVRIRKICIYRGVPCIRNDFNYTKLPKNRTALSWYEPIQVDVVEWCKKNYPSFLDDPLIVFLDDFKSSVRVIIHIDENDKVHIS